MLKRRHIKQLSIRGQIRVAIIAVAVISLLSIGSFAYYIMSKNVEKTYQRSFEYTLDSADRIIELQFDVITQAMREQLMHRTYIELLSEASRGGGTSFQIGERRVLEEEASTLALGNQYIEDILVFSMDGKADVYSKRSELSRYSFLYQSFQINEAEWAVRAQENHGREIIFGNNAITGESDVLMVVKLLVDPYGGEPVGYLAIAVSKQILNKSFENNGHYATNGYLLVDENLDNECIYFVGDSERKESILEDYAKSDPSDSKELFTRQKSSVGNWYLVSYVAYDELNHEREKIALWMFGLVFIIIAVGSLIAQMIAGKIYRPLQSLEESIRHVEEGERCLDAEFDDSEIGLIGQKFNMMVNQKLALREQLLYTELRQKEQELVLLQERINPHFLYNTLDAIYSLAEIEGSDEIAEMVAALSESFRLSLNNGKNLIPVEDEICHIQSYLTIHNMRFAKKAIVEVDVAPVAQEKILKLILEPFVENALRHGLEPKMGQGVIRIVGRKNEDGALCFLIADDGVGMDVASLGESGFGIQNVKERIQLYYGSRSEIQIRSEIGKGTEVSIVLYPRTENGDTGIIGQEKEI